MPLAKLPARLKQALFPVRKDTLPPLVAVGGLRIVVPRMMAGFREKFHLCVVPSPAHALALLRKTAIAAVVHDWDAHPNWRELCGACVARDVPFCLAANAPTDDLFLAVAAAGGACVLWKPLDSDAIVTAVHSFRQ